MIGHPRQQPGHARIVEYRECGPAPARFGCDGRDGGQTGEIDQQEDEQRQGGGGVEIAAVPEPLREGGDLLLRFGGLLPVGIKYTQRTCLLYTSRRTQSGRR